jgi:nucleoid-associated protein YgaU
MEKPETASLVAMWHDGPMEFIDVQFNPTEFTLSRSVQVAEIAIPGLDAPLLQFVRGQSETMTLDLFYDTTEDGMGANALSVTQWSDRIYELTKIEPGGHAPPVCAFIWNSKFPGADTTEAIGGNQKRTDFQCIVESVKQRFTLFSPEGVPLRAVLTVTLREYKPLDLQLRQLNLTSPDRTHSHVVQQGDTLSGIAGRYYRRPGEWREIALDPANRIHDPRRLQVGAFLRVPPLPE